MKVAVLGAGRMGETVLGHCRQSEWLKEAIGYDIRPERVAELRSRGFLATPDLDALLRDPEVRLVFVTSTNASHKELTLRALAAGKAVMCEKPIASTLEDARTMVREAERLGLFFQIGFELRYSLLYTKAKAWIDEGLIGEVINTQCTYLSHSWHKDQWRIRKANCGNLFAEKLTHYVDLPRWWIGSEVESVTSYSAPNIVPYLEMRDNYHTSYRFANGAVSHITYQMGLPGPFYLGDPPHRVINEQIGLDGQALKYLITGTRGAIETDVVFSTLKRWTFRDGEERFESHGAECLTWTSEESFRYVHNTLDQTLDIIRRVQRGEGPKTPARDAYETMRLAFAAERSAEERRTVHLREMPAL